MPCGIAIEFDFFGEVCLCVYDIQVTGTCHQDLLKKSKCLSLTALNRTEQNIPYYRVSGRNQPCEEKGPTTVKNDINPTGQKYISTSTDSVFAKVYVFSAFFVKILA